MDTNKTYQMYLEHSPIGIFVLDKQGSYIDVNRKACEITGYSRDELLKLVISNILHAGDNEAGADVIQYLLGDKEVNTEIQILTKSGEQRLLSVKAVTMDDDTYIAFFTDITEQRKNSLELERNQQKSSQLNKELIRSELRFRSFVESAESAVLFLTTDFKIIEFNPIAEKIFEIKRENVLEKDYLALFMPRVDADKVKLLGGNISLEYLTSLFENEIRTSSGRKYILTWAVNKIIDYEGTLLGFSAVARDITERVAMEEALRKSEKQYRLLFTQLLDGVILAEGIFNSHGHAVDGIVLSVNPAFEQMAGKNAAQMINQHILSIFPDIDKNFIMKLGSIIVEQKPIRIETFSPVLNKYLEIAAFPTQNREIAIILRDIHERVIAEDKLRASLLEKEVMLKEIHHRVKNNLQVISSLLDLQALSFAEENIQEAFRESQNRVKSMAIIHEKIYRSTDLAQIDLKQFIQEMIVHLMSSYKVHTGKIAIIEELESTFMKLESAVPCGLIINELISNVFKHAFPGINRGQVEISLRRLENNFVSIGVKDNGIGLPQGFDYQNTPSLGFQLINALAEQLNAQVELNNSSGTEIKFTFSTAVEK